jgi:ADP-heptose:LPS heptosyltransferase
VPYVTDPDVIPLIYLGGSRIIFRTPGRDTIYRFMVAHPELLDPGPNSEPALARVATMLRHLGCPVGTLAPRLHLGAGPRDHVAAWLRAEGVGETARLVAMHPGASVENKRWPTRHYIALGHKLLTAGADLHLLLTGAPAERRLTREIAAGLGSPGRVTEAAGAMGIEDLPALLARVDLLISADTGVAHIGYAVGTPSVTMFWRSEPALSGPMHDLDQHVVLARQPLCPPCRGRSCRYPVCAEEITPERVLGAALPLLDRRPVAHGSRA